MEQQNIKTETLVDSVFSAMERNAQLAEQETVAIRKAFFEKMKAPLLVDPKEYITTAEVKRVFWFRLNEVVQSNMNYSRADIKELHIHSINPLMIKGTFHISLQWAKEGNYDPETDERYAKHEETIELKRPVKVSTLLMKHIQPMKLDFVKQLALDPETNFKASRKPEDYIDDITERTKKIVQNSIKLLVNKFSAQPLYVYFTDVNHHMHYEKMGEELQLSSCMAYDKEYYGNKYKGKYMHPLQGYEYSPDFRLALFSTHDPETIKTVEGYPFIGRAMVFPSDRIEKPIGYSRYYGTESINGIAEQYFAHIKKPVGKRFYGVICDYHEGSTESDTITRSIRDRFSEGEELTFAIAPFIDTWNNLFRIVNATPYKRHQDGVMVIELETLHNWETCEFDADDKPEEYFEIQNSIHYGTGMVQYSSQDRDECWECYYEDGSWEVGRSEYEL